MNSLMFALIVNLCAMGVALATKMEYHEVAASAALTIGSMGLFMSVMALSDIKKVENAGKTKSEIQ